MTSPDEIRSLEEIGHATWPALEEERRHGWLLRAAGGATRRSNSASPVAASPLEIEDQIVFCERWYAARKLPTIFRLTPAAHRSLDDRLASQGYHRHAGAVIMTRPIADLVWLDDGGTRVELAEAPGSGWLEVMAREPGRSGAMRGVLRRMFGALEAPACFATVHDGDVVAIGLGVVADGYLALYMMQTVASRRREGLGTAVAVALAARGADLGAHHLFLQVHPENTAARAFYQRLGFEPRYEYWYRQRVARSG